MWILCQNPNKSDVLYFTKTAQNKIKMGLKSTQNQLEPVYWILNPQKPQFHWAFHRKSTCETPKFRGIDILSDCDRIMAWESRLKGGRSGVPEAAPIICLFLRHKFRAWQLCHFMINYNYGEAALKQCLPIRHNSLISNLLLSNGDLDKLPIQRYNISTPSLLWRRACHWDMSIYWALSRKMPYFWCGASVEGN